MVHHQLPTYHIFISSFINRRKEPEPTYAKLEFLNELDKQYKKYMNSEK
jgi:hypothetical protein